MQNEVRHTMSYDIQQLKEILFEDLGAELAAKLTDENIRQFDKVLDVCAKIIYHRSKNGCFFDEK